MKSTIFKISLITVILLLSSVTFNSCSKSDEVNKIDEPSLTQEKYKTLLIELNIKFWTNLSSNPISEIQKACIEKDDKKLIQLANFSNKELEDFMNKTIHYSKQLLQNQALDDCNCGNDSSYENIVILVQTIQSNGGAHEFFKEFSKENQSYLKGPGYDPDRLALCLAACFQTCLPLTWNPTAWAACYLACTAICYYLPD